MFTLKSCEPFISAESDYFIYSPSITAKEMFFYPLVCGHFFYQKGYSLYRDSYDSFLLMYIQSGSLILECKNNKQKAVAPCFVLIDCYKPHAYSCEEDCEVLWCHFDGVTAQAYYQTIISHLGNIFSLPNPLSVYNKLNTIYQIFAEKKVIREALVSKYLNDTLTAFLLYSPENNKSSNSGNIIEESIAWINEHFAEEITLQQLASQVHLSQYHFIRIFKKETGFTPHEYLVQTRINIAKYLLKNSTLPIKEICYYTGFSCESVFCSTFKKHLNISPAKYRFTDVAKHS